MDNIRNFLIILTTTGAIIFTANKFCFNFPLIILRLKYKFAFKEASTFETLISTIVLFVYTLIFLVSILAIFLGPHFTKQMYPNNAQNATAKIKFGIYLISLLLAVIGFSLLKSSLESKLNNMGTKYKYSIYILSFLCATYQLVGFFTEFGVNGCVEMALNGEKIIYNNVDLTKEEFRRDNIKVFINDDEIKIDNNLSTGRLNLIYNNTIISFKVDSNIKLRDYDYINIKVDKNSISKQYTSMNEIVEYLRSKVFLFLYYSIIVLYSGIIYFNYKLNNNNRYILYTNNNKEYTCSMFLEIDDFYFFKYQGKETHIGKKEVNRVEVKVLEQVNRAGGKVKGWKHSVRISIKKWKQINGKNGIINKVGTYLSWEVSKYIFYTNLIYVVVSFIFNIDKRTIFYFIIISWLVYLSIMQFKISQKLRYLQDNKKLDLYDKEENL